MTSSPLTHRRRPAALVALVALVAACGCGGAPGSQPPADLILEGARVVVPGAPAADAIAVRDGRVATVGPAAGVRALRGPATRVIALDGGAIVPAFVDHHVHLLNVGLSLLNAELDEALYLDLSTATSLDEVEARVRARAASLPPGAWILGKGWSQSAWGAAALPDHAPLTRAAPRHPVLLTRTDGHAGWVNRAALEAAGIRAGTSDPPGGSIARGPGGVPTGILLERAVEPVLSLVPLPDAARIARAFRLAADALAARGVAEAFDAGFLAPPGIVGLNLDMARVLALLEQEDARQPLPIRINLMVPAPGALADAVLARPAASRQLSPRLTITHIKLFADGALGSRGAWLSHRYADDPATSGVPRMSGGDIHAQASRAIDAGLDVAVHAIGDRGVGLALDAFERLLAARPDVAPGRLRVEHFSYASEADLRRAAALGVVLVVQPGFVYPDAAGVTMEDGRVGPENSARVYALGTLRALGARLAGSTDDFGAPGPPLLAFFAAVTRQNPGGAPAEGWHPGERLSRDDGLRLVTRRHPPGGGAPVEPLSTGAPADLVVLSADPREAAAGELVAIRVVGRLSGREWARFEN